MKKLSVIHKNNISKGLRRSEKHRMSQMDKNVYGENNPNWRPKVIYQCPVCNKKLLVTEKKFLYMKKKARTCSRQCGNIIGREKIRGKSRPDVSERMKRDNPMFNPSIALKMSISLKKRFASGDLDNLKKKLVISGRRNRIKSNKKIRNRKKTAIRMKKNNPMFDKEVAKKVSRSLILGYKNGSITPPELSGSRFKRGYFIDRYGSTHHYDSGWELKRMEFLNSFRTINWEKNKSFKVGYLLNGKYKNYFPDFVISRKGSNKIIVEEIGLWIGNKEVKIKRAEKYFQRKGIKYVVLSKKSELQNKTW